jgi:hypothetical protein
LRFGSASQRTPSGTSPAAASCRAPTAAAQRSSASSKLTNGTYRSTFIDALASAERGAGLYRARGEREGRSIDIDQLLLFTIQDGLVTEVVALPSEPAAFDAFWA